MGTRADFYVGRGEHAEWLGSIAMDGYPDGPGRPREYAVLTASTEEEYRAAVTKMLAETRDATTPDQGWPWPWEDSKTTDYAYAWDDGHVWGSAFGYEWWDARGEDPEPKEDPAMKTAIFPNMEQRKNVTLGPRSGLIVLSAPHVP